MGFDRQRAARAGLVACAVAVAGAQAARAVAPGAHVVAPSAANPYSVTVEQCLSASVQSERSVTFVAQMEATPATQKMALRIDLEQRLRGEGEYHTVAAPGLGVWRASEPGVKIYKYVKQITNLAAPAAYRAVVHFRWVGDRGRVIKRAEARSTRCFQPAPSP